MMRIKDYIYLLLIGGSLVFSLLSYYKEDKLAYVDTRYVLQNFKGTKEASNVLYQQEQQWQSEIDSLKELISIKADLLEADAAEMNLQDVQKEQLAISLLEREMTELAGARSSKFHKADEQLTLGIMNQVNTAIQTYCRENDYLLVMGNEVPGNVLYGDEAINITEEVLSQLNETYLK